MNLTIHALEGFVKEAKRLQKKYKKLSEDLKTVRKTLSENPKAGIELSHNCYKIRLANSSIPTGKSGGFRVIYYFIDSNDNLYLMSIYSKTEIESISEARLVEILNANGLS